MKMHSYRNTVYGHPEWAKHKSSWRHLRHLTSIARSGVILGIGPPVLLSTLTAVFVTLINYGVQKEKFASWVPLLEIAITPYNLIAPVLAFLLVFRTNSSYQRFDEARKVWGSNVNRTRDLARQLLTWIRHPDDKPKLELMLRHIKAYPYFLKHHLTEGSKTNSIDEVIELLTENEVEKIRHAQNRPIYILQVLSAVMSQCEVPEFERVAMDSNLTQFHDNVGACERIFKTPIPVAYTRLTSRMLILWHLALPYGLWPGCGWLTIPATFMSAVALFYIEQVGVLIEEPFWILALDSICGGITNALNELCCAHKEALVMDWKTPPAPPSKVSHHVHHHKAMTQIQELEMAMDAPNDVENEQAPMLVGADEDDDRVVVNFERSFSHHHHGHRPSYGDLNHSVFSRLKSIS